MVRRLASRVGWHRGFGETNSCAEFCSKLQADKENESAAAEISRGTLDDIDEANKKFIFNQYLADIYAIRRTTLVLYTM